MCTRCLSIEHAPGAEAAVRPRTDRRLKRSLPLPEHGHGFEHRLQCKGLVFDSFNRISRRIHEPGRDAQAPGREPLRDNSQLASGRNRPLFVLSFCALPASAPAARSIVVIAIKLRRISFIRIALGPGKQSVIRLAGAGLQGVGRTELIRQLRKLHPGELRRSSTIRRISGLRPGGCAVRRPSSPAIAAGLQIRGRRLSDPSRLALRLSPITSCLREGFIGRFGLPSKWFSDCKSAVDTPRTNSSGAR